MAAKAGEPVLIEVGARIRAARLGARLNLQELARLTGISIGALSQIETGRRDARLTTLARIAGALRLAPAALIGREPTGEADPASGSGGYDLGEYE